MPAKRRKLITCRHTTPWQAPFKVGKGFTMVAKSVWGVRWHRLLNRQQKLQRAQMFQKRSARYDN